MTKSTTQTVQREMLLGLVDEGYDKIGWMEVSFLSAIRRVSAKEAVWQSRPGRKSIAEIVLHSAYWKYATARRITGGKRGSFPLAVSNWFAVPRKLSGSSTSLSYPMRINRFAKRSLLHRGRSSIQRTKV